MQGIVIGCDGFIFNYTSFRIRTDLTNAMIRLRVYLKLFSVLGCMIVFDPILIKSKYYCYQIDVKLSLNSMRFPYKLFGSSISHRNPYSVLRFGKHYDGAVISVGNSFSFWKYNRRHYNITFVVCKTF